MTAILVSNCNDWEGLYIDGVLVDQDHKVDFKYWAGKISGELVEKEVDSAWLGETVGQLPENYNDIPVEVFL